MEYIALITAIITLVVGPLLAFGLKLYWDKKAADAAAEKKRAEQEKEATDVAQDVKKETQEVGQVIDDQRQAGEDWVAKNPILPPKENP